MPQRPIPAYWKGRVKFHLTEAGGKITPRRIRQRLVAEAEEMSKSGDPKTRELAPDSPSERSISRIRQYEWEPLAPSERAAYGLLQWPESFEAGALPWEASAAALELLAVFDGLNDGRGSSPRPNIGIARWYWRVCQAAPDLAPIGKAALAMVLAGARNAGTPLLDGMEWWLAYAPWRNPAAAVSYERATSREKAPIPRYPLREDLLSVLMASLEMILLRLDAFLKSEGGREALNRVIHAAKEATGAQRKEEDGNAG